MEHAWEALSDEELLGLRMCDLGLKIEGSKLEPRDEPALLIDIGSYLSALVTNYLHTGKFKRSV